MCVQGCDNVSDRGMRILADSSTLTHLHLVDNVCVGDDGVRALAHMRALTKLELVGFEGVTEEGLLGLLSGNLTKTSLTHLNLSQSDVRPTVTPTVCAALAHMPSLRTLVISSSRITDPCLEALAGSSSITSLDLSINELLTDRGVLALNNVESLTEVNFSQCCGISERCITWFSSEDDISSGDQDEFRACARCNSSRSSDGTRLRKCAGCKTVKYCSIECQGWHWKNTHKQECWFLSADFIERTC